MYESSNGYGGLAGFSGPALGDGSPVEVVRFQDLHRKHAPASAGLPEVGNFAAPPESEAPMHFGDVMASPDFGGFAFGTVPSYGAFGYAGPSYEDLKSYPTLSTGSSDTAKVKALQDALVAKGLMSQADLQGSGYGKFGPKTEAAVKTANTRATGGAVSDGTVRLYTWAYLYGVDAPSAATAKTEAKTEAVVAETTTTKQSQRQQAQNEESDLARKARELVEGVLTGVKEQRGAALDAQRQQVSDVKPPAEENKALTYALWAGGALLGIGAIVLLVKAVSDDDDDKKKGE